MIPAERKEVVTDNKRLITKIVERKAEKYVKMGILDKLADAMQPLCRNCTFQHKGL